MPWGTLTVALAKFQGDIFGKIEELEWDGMLLLVVDHKLDGFVLLMPGRCVRTTVMVDRVVLERMEVVLSEYEITLAPLLGRSVAFLLLLCDNMVGHTAAVKFLCSALMNMVELRGR
jgi:hypothetical protein